MMSPSAYENLKFAVPYNLSILASLGGGFGAMKYAQSDDWGWVAFIAVAIAGFLVGSLAGLFAGSWLFLRFDDLTALWARFRR